jgi:acyl-CoA thioester hydrolase
MFVHEMQMRVLYADTDKAEVVYYGNYLRFFEAGRTEYFRALGKSYADFEKMGILLTVVEARARYLGPAFYDDLITIRTWITRMRRTRIDFAYEVRNPAGKPICKGATTLGCIGAASRRPEPLPEEMAGLLRGCVESDG